MSFTFNKSQSTSLEHSPSESRTLCWSGDSSHWHLLRLAELPQWVWHIGVNTEKLFSSPFNLSLRLQGQLAWNLSLFQNARRVSFCYFHRSIQNGGRLCCSPLPGELQVFMSAFSKWKVTFKHFGHRRDRCWCRYRKRVVGVGHGG